MPVATKTDEFSEKFQTAFDPPSSSLPPSFSEDLLHIFIGNFWFGEASLIDIYQTLPVALHNYAMEEDMTARVNEQLLNTAAQKPNGKPPHSGCFLKSVPNVVICPGVFCQKFCILVFWYSGRHHSTVHWVGKWPFAATIYVHFDLTLGGCR